MLRFYSNIGSYITLYGSAHIIGINLKDRHPRQESSQKSPQEASTLKQSSPCVALNLSRYHNQNCT